MAAMTGALGIAILLAATPAPTTPDKPITLWLAKGDPIDTAGDTLVVVGDIAGHTKLGKACAKSEGKFPRWTILAVSRSGLTFATDVVSDATPMGEGTRIGSLRLEGECKEGSRTMLRYTGVIERIRSDRGRFPPRGRSSRLRTRVYGRAFRFTSGGATPDKISVAEEAATSRLDATSTRPACSPVPGPRAPGRR